MYCRLLAWSIYWQAYGMASQAIVVKILSRDIHVPILWSPHPDWLWGSPRLLVNSYWGATFLWHRMDLCIVPMLRLRGAMPPFPHMASWCAVINTTSLLYLPVHLVTQQFWNGRSLTVTITFILSEYNLISYLFSCTARALILQTMVLFN